MEIKPRKLRCRSAMHRTLVFGLLYAVLLPSARTLPSSLPTSASAQVQYGDLSFDPQKWTLVENGQTLGFVPNGSLATQGHLKVGPIGAAPPKSGGFFGNQNMRAVVEQIWARVAAGQTIKGSNDINESVPLSFGGNHQNANAYYHKAHLASGGCAGVLVVEANGKTTPFEMTLDTSQACYVLMETFDFIMETLQVRPGAPPAPALAPPSEPIGSPSGLGDDPYDSVDWNGPDDWAYGIYDIHPINVKRELKVIALLAPDFIGSVTPKPITFDQAIANLRTLADTPYTKSQYAEFKELGNKDPSTLQGTAWAGVLAGEPVFVLLQLFAAYEIHPEDANNWLNLAAMCSHVRLANESTAILTEMGKRGKKPDPPVISGEAAVEYLIGYNQLLFGQTLTAKGHLHKATDLDPFLKEAAIALALAYKLTGDEEAAEAAYIQGVWRRRPSQTLYCGGTSGGPDGQPIRPPITDMLDVSHGSPGALPNFDHPNNWSEALGLRDRYERPIFQMKDEGIGYTRQGSALLQRIHGHPRDATNKWHEYLDSLILTLHDEPAVKKALAAKEKANKELDEAVKKIGKRTAPKLISILMQPGDHHDELALIATDNVASLRPFAQAYDTVTRRLYRIEHRFKTGLIAQMGDDDWHQLEVTRLNVDARSTYADLIGPLIGSYMLVANIVPPPKPPPQPVSMDPEDAPKCPNGVRNLGLKVSFDVPLVPIKLGLKGQCDKVSVEAGVYPWKLEEKYIVEVSAGAFVQADFTGKGDVTIFSGVTGKGGVGPYGAGVTGKAGVYVSTNVHTGEIKDLGVKATVDLTSKFGDNLSVSIKGGEAKDSIIPSIPQSPRGTDLGDHRRMSP